MDLRAWIGRKGERFAERHLRRQGYRLVVRNYSCPLGEIDLVMVDGDTIVFVEVKTRTADDTSSATQAINRQKRLHMIRTARYFIQETGVRDKPWRFDVVAVVRDSRNRKQAEHYPNAFAAVEG